MNKTPLDETKAGQLLSRRALADRWDCSTETIKRRTRDGTLKPLKFGPRNLRYRLQDILAIEAAADTTTVAAASASTHAAAV